MSLYSHIGATVVDVRCCCKPENSLGSLPAGLPYETRELNDGTHAYVAHSLPEDVKAMIDIHKRGGGGKTWANSPKKRKKRKK